MLTLVHLSLVWLSEPLCLHIALILSSRLLLDESASLVHLRLWLVTSRSNAISSIVWVTLGVDRRLSCSSIGLELVVSLSKGSLVVVRSSIVLVRLSLHSIRSHELALSLRDRRMAEGLRE